MTGSPETGQYLEGGVEGLGVAQGSLVGEEGTTVGPHRPRAAHRVLWVAQNAQIGDQESAHAACALLLVSLLAEHSPSAWCLSSGQVYVRHACCKNYVPDTAEGAPVADPSDDTVTMQKSVLPGEVKALVEEEEALYAAAPLAGGRCQAQAAPSHLTHLLPDMLSLHIQETISGTYHTAISGKFFAQDPVLDLGC